MNNKVVAMKENKLGVLGWFVKNTIGGKLNNIALAMIPKLSKEQALALLKITRHENCPEIVKNINELLKKDKELIVAAIYRTQSMEDITKLLEATNKILQIVLQEDITIINYISNIFISNITSKSTINIDNRTHVPAEYYDFEQDNMHDIKCIKEEHWIGEIETKTTYTYHYSHVASYLEQLPESIRAKVIEALPTEHKKQIIDELINNLTTKYKIILLTKAVKTDHDSRNEMGPSIASQDSTSRQMHEGYEPWLDEPTQVKVPITITTYGLNESSVEKCLGNFPKEVIEGVKARLANETRTETTTD